MPLELTEMPVVFRVRGDGRGKRLYSTLGPGEPVVLQADALNAVAVARGTAPPISGTLTRETNEALTAFHRRWHLEADWLVCQGCKRPLIASRDGEPTSHAVGCKNADSLHPWAELRGLITPTPKENHV
jgi:hypothetical protein